MGQRCFGRLRMLTLFAGNGLFAPLGVPSSSQGRKPLEMANEKRKPRQGRREAQRLIYVAPDGA